MRTTPGSSSYIIMLILLMGASLSCQKEAPSYSGPVQINLEEVPYNNLSEYGFFTGPLKKQIPNHRVLPYELNTPLFSDYAHKARFVWMPEGTNATVDSLGELSFPNGTALIKTFYYPADFRKPDKNHDLIETRLLIKKKDTWHAYNYVWNEDQTEAERNVIGDIQAVSWLDPEGKSNRLEYIVPNKNQCKSCHNRAGQITPIGPRIAHLNGEINYSDQPENQLDKWVASGYLILPSSPEYLPAAPRWDDPNSGSLHERALAYLDINCGHCHHPRGPAHTTGLYLQLNQTDPGQLGLCKTPVAAGKGSGGRHYSITPGKPDSSILVFRMEDGDPGIMMPELGRVIPHVEGIKLIREWIANMDTTCL